MEQLEQQKIQVVPANETFEKASLEHFSGMSVGEEIVNTIERIEYPEQGGILVWKKGDKYPTKGFPFIYAVYGVDVVKKTAINALKFLVSKPVVYFLPLLLVLPKKRIITSALEQWADAMDRTLLKAGAYREYRYLADCVRATWDAGMKVAGDSALGKLLTKIICACLEFDDAYRAFYQDAMELVDLPSILANPGRELTRVLNIVIERGKGTAPKFKVIAKVLPYVLKLKMFKEPIIAFFKEIELEKVYMDNADWYKALIWGGYQFRGVSDVNRMATRMMIDAEWMYREKVPGLERSLLTTKK